MAEELPPLKLVEYGGPYVPGTWGLMGDSGLVIAWVHNYHEFMKQWMKSDPRTIQVMPLGGKE